MKPIQQKASATPPVVVASEVARRIRQHARSHLKTEVCGVLIGGIKDGTLHVEECIAGKDAAQAGTHVTFTQDTWEHIYKVKDAEFPNDRIVGWYHSHPGFGIFLSDHDTFIHRNFFSAPEQVAWVYDPHSDEEGFFGWAEERIARLGLVSFRDSRGGEECTENHGAMESMLQDPDQDFAVIAKPRQDEKEEHPAVRWIGAILTHLVALALGVLIAWYVFPRVIVLTVDPRTGSPSIELPPDANSSAPSQAPATSPSSTANSNDASKPEHQKKGDDVQPK